MLFLYTPNMKTKYLSLAVLAAVAFGQTACQAKGTFKKLPSGLQYQLVKDAPGKNIQEGDILELHVVNKFKDSVLYDSRKMNNNMPVPLRVAKPSFGGDLMEVFPFLSVNDSVIVRIPLDSVLKMGAPMLPGMEKGKGQSLEYSIKIVSAKSEAEARKEMEAKAAAQISVDDKELQQYFAQKGLKPLKTAGGVYYTVEKAGTGEALQPGQQVTMNYTGMLLDGTKFDSNVDPKFSHVQPFQFALGTGQVIRGWDEGVAMFKKGGKGVLYIPSALAYGANSPSPAIPANAILMFEVEVVDATAAGAAPAPMIQEAPHDHNGSEPHNH